MRTSEGRLSRAEFLRLSGLTATAVLLGTGELETGRAYATPSFSANPFSLGVASGDPRHTSVVLWTRLAPDPFAQDGLYGMSPEPVRVRYEVAKDEGFRRVVDRGAVTATPELGHSVHVDARWLRPGFEYFYRFKAGAEISPTGRTRTTPVGRVDRLRFALAGCQRWQEGYYTAHGAIAADEDLDLVVFSGDYMYETGFMAVRDEPIADHLKSECYTLADYRWRYGLHKTDPQPPGGAPEASVARHLGRPRGGRQLRGAVPRARRRDGGVPGPPRRRVPGVLRAHAAAAVVAARRSRHVALSHGPLRAARRVPPAGRAPVPQRPGLWRPAFDAVPGVARPRADDARRRARRRGCSTGWTGPALSGTCSPSRRSCAAPTVTPVPGSRPRWTTGTGTRRPAQRLFDGIAERGVENLVVLTGDAHCSLAADLRLQYDDPNSPAVGAEIVGTSISSGGDGDDLDERGEEFLTSNPHIRFYNARRGYVSCDVTREAWRSDFRALPYVTQPGATPTTIASFVTLAGVPGLQPA